MLPLYMFILHSYLSTSSIVSYEYVYFFLFFFYTVKEEYVCYPEKVVYNDFAKNITFHSTISELTIRTAILFCEGSSFISGLLVKIHGRAHAYYNHIVSIRYKI